MSKQFFISTGDKAGFYTLRVVVPKYVGGQWIDGSDYLCTLSTDWDAAVEKAREYLREHYAGTDCKLYGDEFKLQDIQRRKSEDLAAEREAAEQAAIQREITRAAENRMAIEVALRDERITFGKFGPQGTSKGMTFRDCAENHLDYCRWIRDRAEEIAFDIDAAKHPQMLNRLEVCAVAFVHWAAANGIDLSEPAAGAEYVGTEGDKIQIELTVERMKDAHFTAPNGATSYSWLYFCRDAAGNHVNFKTASRTFDDVHRNDSITVTGTVKSHSEFNGAPNTWLARVKCVAHQPKESAA